MIDRMAGAACQGFGSARLAKLLPKMTCDQMRPFIKQLEEIDAQTVTWKEVLRNQNRLNRALLGDFPNPMNLVSDHLLDRNRGAYEQRHNLAAAHLRLLTVELALRCSRCDEGNASVSLEHLLPKYVHRMPKD